MRPSTPLRPFIDRVWGHTAVGQLAQGQPSALLPGTGAELFLHHRTPKGARGANEPAARLFCLRTRPRAIEPGPALPFTAVRFRIGMLGRFLDIPESEIADQVLSARDLWGVAVDRLVDELSNAAGPLERLQAVEHFLLERWRPLSRDPVVESALQALYSARGGLSLGTLAQRAALGDRQLQRRWRAFTGLTIQHWQGMCRFQHAARALSLHPQVPALDVALSHGYSDQAHFIREFRRRSGTTPARLRASGAAVSHFFNTSLP